MPGTGGSDAPARLPPWTSPNHRVPELIRPHIRKPPSPSRHTPISVRCGSAATESRLSSLGSKGSERGNASRCRPSGGLPSGGEGAGGAAGGRGGGGPREPPEFPRIEGERAGKREPLQALGRPPLGGEECGLGEDGA